MLFFCSIPPFCNNSLSWGKRFSHLSARSSNSPAGQTSETPRVRVPSRRARGSCARNRTAERAHAKYDGVFHKQTYKMYANDTHLLVQVENGNCTHGAMSTGLRYEKKLNNIIFSSQADHVRVRASVRVCEKPVGSCLHCRGPH